MRIQTRYRWEDVRRDVRRDGRRRRRNWVLQQQPIYGKKWKLMKVEVWRTDCNRQWTTINMWRKTHTHTHELLQRNSCSATRLAAQWIWSYNPPFKILPDKLSRHPGGGRLWLLLFFFFFYNICVRISEVVGSHVTVKVREKHLIPLHIYIYIYVYNHLIQRKCWVQGEAWGELHACRSLVTCGSQDLHWYAGKSNEHGRIFLNIYIWDYAFGSLKLCSLRLVSVYVRRATKWKCHMPWCQ